MKGPYSYSAGGTNTTQTQGEVLRPTHIHIKASMKQVFMLPEISRDKWMGQVPSTIALNIPDWVRVGGK